MVDTTETRCIVVIEDDHAISDLVSMYLRRDGYRVLQADDGESGIAYVEGDQDVRLVVLDIGLPGALDGYEVCRRLRQGHPSAAILMLTARDEELDKVIGLEIGADDYMTKPFSPRELVARAHAILRRLEPPLSHDERLSVGAIDIDTVRREASLKGEPVAMTSREFDLLVYLASHQGIALSRRRLLDGVWGEGWYGDARTVDVHVRQLRRKFGEELPLATVWGVGYRLG